MKFFTNKKFLFKLIATLCVFLALFNFCTVPTAQADVGELVTKTGGKLLDPVCDLLLVIGDGIMEVFQDAIMGKEATAMYDNAKESWWAKAGKILLFAVIFVGVCLLTAGVGALAACLPLIGSALAAGLTSGVVVAGGSLVAYSLISGAFLPEVIVLPTYYIGPEEIFSGKILLFDVNVFNPKKLYVKMSDADGNLLDDEVTAEELKKQKQKGEGKYISAQYQEAYYYYYEDGNIVKTSVNSTAQDMKETIAKWYYVIRNIAIIGLLLVLVYVGIRMLLSSVSSEKAKYKQMLSDWVIAFCLIFLMQYIMVFANEFVEGITNILASASDEKGHIAIIENAPEKLINAIGTDTEIIPGEKVVQNGSIYWPTNLMGKMRVLAQQKDGTTGYVGYVACFAVLVIFTVCFIITYLKRVLYVLFLTVIAPFVAMTYPLDKIRDGKAQAFDLWMKEYICNLIIQPFHLLLYTIFVTMAFELAGTNVIYSLVVLGFMMPAEKFLRKMFGFDRASTPGFLNGATGAAMTMTALHSLSKFAGRGPGGNKAINSKGGNETDKAGAEYLNRGKSKSVQDLLGNIAGAPSNGQMDEGDNAEGEKKQPGSDNPNPKPIDGGDSQQKEQNQRIIENPEDEEIRKLKDELDNADYNDMYMNPDYYNERQAKLDELENAKKAREKQEEQKEPELKPEQTKQLPKPKIRDYASAAGRNIKRNASGITKKKIAKKALTVSAKNGLRAGSKFVLGSAAAIAGASAGVAAGDLGSVGKNAAAGLVAGEAIGAGLANRTINRAERIATATKDAKQDTLKEIYGEDYSEYMRQEKDRKFKKDAEMRKLYARELGLKKKEDIDAAMEDAIKYREYGVEDNDVIIKAMTMNNGNQSNRAEASRIGAARLSMQSKSLKDLESTMKRFKETVKDPNKIKQMENDIKQINNL